MYIFFIFLGSKTLSKCPKNHTYFETDLELEKPQETFNLFGLFCCHHISDGKKYHFCTSWSISIKSQGYRNRYSLIDKPSGSCSFREKIWPLIFTTSEIFFFQFTKHLHEIELLSGAAKR